MNPYTFAYSMVFYLIFLNPLYADSCNLPCQGIQGLTGPRGATGPQGPTGPVGPFGLGNSLSVSLQNTQSVEDQDSVLFDMLSQNQGSITYNPVTGVATLANIGFYSITFGISTSASNLQFSIRLNGSSFIPGTTIDSQSSTMVGESFFVEITSVNSTIELVNNSGVTATLQSSLLSSNSAFLLIYQIQ